MFYFLLAWGSHWDKTDTPYLTAAAAIGMTKEDVMTFARRLDKVMASRSKTKPQVSAVVSAATPKTPSIPTIEVERNGSPGSKKLTYV